MKKLGLIIAVLAVTGCASTNSEYYEAVQKTAEANAMANKAKFDALSAIASSGDGQAASAAVMALALTQTQSVTPIPQQSEALQWASILATPVTSLGMMWMQADSAKTMARYNADVDLARISADASTQQALYGSFVASNATTADVALGGFNAMGNIDYTPFVNGMVDLGTAGITGAVDLGTAGFNANTDIATVGLNTAGQLGVTGMNNLTNLGAAGYVSLVGLGTAGLNTATALGTAGLDSTVAMGTAGLDSTVAMGTAGLDTATTLGTAGLTTATTLGVAGMDGISGVATDGFTNMLNIDAANNSLFSGIWTDYQTSLQAIIDSIPDPVMCSASADPSTGATSITCN